MAIVSGAQNALAITLLALFEPGNRIAVDIYTYANFIEISKMFRIKLVPIPGDEHGMLPVILNCYIHHPLRVPTIRCPPFGH
jgi:DNA-binding transcriptional MocR family regulator